MRRAIQQSKNLESKQYIYLHYIIEYSLKSTNLSVNEHVHSCHTTKFRPHEIPLTLRRGYYNHALRQVAYLFNKVILCIQEHAVMFVQV